VDYIVTSGPAAFTNNSGAGFVTVSKPRITGITMEATDTHITWTTAAGRTNFVQSTAGDTGGGYTNSVADIGLPIVVPGSGLVSTNYTDTGSATNFPARFYRVRLAP
jgi:hypothetical protein